MKPHEIASLAGAPPLTRELITLDAEARAFQRVRWHTVRTLLRQAIFHGRLRLGMIAVLSVVLWGGLYLLFHEGFAFLEIAIPSPDIYDQLVRKVFGVFFGALMVMLLLSAAIILYSSLFRGRDVPFLLTIPARAERVFLMKFQDAILMSSWAFVLLGSPVLLAYGVVRDAPWPYFAMLLPFLLAFIYVPAAVGALLCLGVIRYLPNAKTYVLTLVVLLMVAGVATVGYLVASRPEDMLSASGFRQMLRRLQFIDMRLLPSWWLTTGLLEAARGEVAESMQFLALMVSNAFFFRLLGAWTAGRLYRDAFTRLHGQRVSRKRTRVAWVDRVVLRAAAWLPQQARLLIVKDLRLFRRDPVQWSQILIFIGFLFLYFFSIPGLHYDAYRGGWVNFVSFLNVSVVGLLLSTFTTRFIFPMISLEGHRFWILGLLPLHRDRILWSKFVFAVGFAIIPSSLLILVSDLMLQIDPLIAASHQLTCLILCFGLAGISVGLGAKMPNFREQSPSRIAAGFGGTLTLVLSTLYIITVVLLTAVPCHFYLGASGADSVYLGDAGRFLGWIETWLVIGLAASLLLGAVATVVPLILGIRAFRKLEFH